MKRVLIILAVLIPAAIANGQKNDITDPEQYGFVKSVQNRQHNKPECDELVELADSVVNFSFNKATGLFSPVQVTHYSYDSRNNLTVNHVIALPERTNVLRQVFEYDNNDNQTKYTNYNWIDGAWEKTLFVERSYNLSGEITTEVYYRKEPDGTYKAYMRHFYSYSGGRPVNYLRQMTNSAGEWYDFSYHNYVYDYMGRLKVLYGQYINGPVFWERTSVFEGDEKGASERYFKQLKYDPVLKKNDLANIVYQLYSHNIYGNASEILYHGWSNNTWEVNGKAILYYSIIDGKKVSICHNGKTICVSTHAVRAHLEHGDKLGPCVNSESKNNANDQDKSSSNPENVKFSVFPNPAQNVITIRFDEPEIKYTHGLIVSTAGVVVAQLIHIDSVQFDYDVSRLMVGQYYIKMYRADGMAETRILIKKK